VTDTDQRLTDMLDKHVVDSTSGGWKIDPVCWAHGGYKVASPVEPCDQCGQKVFLFLDPKWDRPRWQQLGELKDGDTLFPKIGTRRHKCGDGDSWSVEAALFVADAMREWGLTEGVNP